MNIQEPLTLDKTEAENNLQSDSQPESGNQDEGKCLIEALPSEMLMEILECLDVKSLAVSRLVSREWSAMARGILKSRDDVETVFVCSLPRDGQFPKIYGKTQDTSLESFIQCFEDSTEYPLYTRFRFHEVTAHVFDHADWNKFISDFGPSIKSLKLIAESNLKKLHEFTKLAEKVRHVLVNQLPKLGEFGLYLPRFCKRTRPFQSLRLFSTTTSIQLPHLKVLYLDEMMFSTYTEIATDLLRAAVNLQKLDSFAQNCPYRCIETFQLLQSLGKLDCLQNASIDLDSRFMSEIQGQSSAPLAFKLKKLALHIPLIDSTNAFCLDASVFLSNLFESSKDTLRELTTNSLGFLPGFQFSKLQVPWTGFSPHDENQNQNDLYFPSLNTLVILDYEMAKEDILRISQVCPKLKNFTADYLRCGGERENLPQVAEAIWTHLTQLESLDLEIDIHDPADGFPALDSSFTGFSRENCSRLHGLVQNEKSTEKQGSKIKSESKNQLDAERNNPSILDLKEPLRYPKWTSVIEQCAFKLMKNLTYKITNS